MGTREVLTLQFGHYSNFVGTHWWNIQETGFDYDQNTPSQINHDVLFREGINNNKQTTYTPRVLLVDLRGSLKSLPKLGTLYNLPVENEPSTSKHEVSWQSDLVEVQEDLKTEKNNFQQDLDSDTPESVLKKVYNLEEKVHVWSDFLYSRFHPRSVNLINDYQFQNEHTPFDLFPSGRNLWQTVQFQDDFSDNIRWYVEECNNFQGFHVLNDCTDAFGGLSASCLEYLQDEYDKKAILAFPLIQSHYSDQKSESHEERHKSLIKDCVRTLNTAFTFNSLTSNSSLYVPLCTGSTGWRQPGASRQFYHTKYNSEIAYHSSAILASAVDTFTLKHRLKATDFSLVDLCVDLSPHGRKAAAGSLCLPFSLNADADLIDCLDNWEGPLSQCITPRCSIGTDRVMQHITLRGIPENRLKRPPHEAKKQLDLPAYKTNSVQEMLSLYLSCSTYATASNVTVVNRGMSTRTPFPNLFDERLNGDGNVAASSRPAHIRVDSVPVLAGLHCGESVGEMLESLHTEVNKIKFKKFHQFIEGGMEYDEYVECLDSLFELRENYEDNYVI